MESPKRNQWVPKARDRFVSFRVTDGEFRQIKLACDLQGAPGLSAFARQIILNVASSSSDNIAERITALDRRLSVIEVSLLRLSKVLEEATVHKSEK